MKNAIKFEIGKEYKGSGEVHGIIFELVKRLGDICLFKRSDNYFEVIKITHQKERNSTIAGRKVNFKKREVLPNGSDWNGKCVKSLERANELFDVKVQFTL